MRKLAILVLLALLCPACKHEDCENTAPRNAPIAIAKPCDSSKVGWRTLIAGRVANPQSKVHLIIHPLEVSDYWVQPRITVNSDGSWQVLAYFGHDGNVDRGKPYEIMAIADPTAEIKEGESLKDWPLAKVHSDVVRLTRN